VSAARPSRHRPAELAPPPAEIAALRTRRRMARRRRRLARIDIGLGVGAAVVLLIASPGLAITGLIAALALAACATSILAPRLAHRRKARPRRTPGSSRSRSWRAP
jgi:hypothetical protein